MKILIDTDWSMFLEDLPAEKQLEFFWAVFDYGNHDCSLKCWSKIQPILEKGKIGYYNKLKKLKQYADTDTDTDTVRGSVSVSKSKSVNSRVNTSSKSYTHVNPTEQEVLDYAKQQDDMAGVGGFAVSQQEAQAFYDYYSGIGWVVSNDARTPIVDWKPFLRKWAKNPRFKNRESDTVDINDPDHFLI